jgi:uncharacterized protein DUF7002
MDSDELVAHYPLLFHMTEARTWPTIKRFGLHSVTSLLDLFEIRGDLRCRLESERRPHATTLRSLDRGDVVVRDQKPLNVDKLAACLIDMTVIEWLRLLNRKVFFWVGEHRVNELLGAQAYRNRAHMVLVVETASLVAAHEVEITLSAINTGSTLYDPRPRGSDTLLPIAQYPFEHWRRLRQTPRKAVAELAVDYALPDIVEHLVRVERRQCGYGPELVWKP